MTKKKPLINDFWAYFKEKIVKKSVKLTIIFQKNKKICVKLTKSF
jgi:hypothetical protein